MMTETRQTPGTRTGGSQDGWATDSKIPQLPRTPWLRRLGCPAGCGVVHECGVGEELVPLPAPGPRERGGRDLTLQQLAAIAARWLDRRYVA